eukprot:786925-Prorocentrum_lima.AAC.1
MLPFRLGPPATLPIRMCASRVSTSKIQTRTRNINYEDMHPDTDTASEWEEDMLNDLELHKH